MRHVPNDKYTIAWFKLAECIAKGEKEKAFGVYRLLRHSLDDQAYAYRLEGDLLDAFHDTGATEKYAQAAHLYYASKRYKEASSLYEELVALEPKNEAYFSRLMELYRAIPSLAARKTKFDALLVLCKEKRYFSRAVIVVAHLHECSPVDEIIHSYCELIPLVGDPQTEDGISILNAALAYLKSMNDVAQTDHFFDYLQQIGGAWHAQALQMVGRTE